MFYLNHMESMQVFKDLQSCLPNFSPVGGARRTVISVRQITQVFEVYCYKVKAVYPLVRPDDRTRNPSI